IGKNTDAVTGDFSNITLFQIDESVSDLAQCQWIRGNKVFTDAYANYQRAAAAGNHQMIRFGRVDCTESVGTVQERNNVQYCAQHVLVVAYAFTVQQVHDNFSIGVRQELVTICDQFLAQAFVVFNNAVVHQRKLVTGEVGVCIALAGYPVSGPAGVGDAGAAACRLGKQLVSKFLDLANSAYTFEGSGFFLDDCKTGRVVTAVLQTFEPFQQNTNNVTLGNATHNSTHKFTSSVCLLFYRALPAADVPLFATGNSQFP